MASSNRHWPRMFKSKPCNNQWKQDINQSLISSAGQRPTYSSVSGCEERSSEPKPRWNPKPEQIRILEAIFNSGMVNPPRDEIRKIRSQLLEYGQVGDANVFYWFQNRKSRTKYKLRHLHNSKQNHNSHQQQPQQQQKNPPSNIFVDPACSSSSSSSDKSSPKDSSFNSINKPFSNSPNASVNQTTFFQTNMITTTNDFLNESFIFPLHHSTSTPTDKENSNFGSEAQAFCFSTHDQLSNNVPHQNQQDPSTGLLLTEIMNHHGSSKRNHQGVGEQEAVGPDGAAKSTVFINDVPFEVASGPFNVRDAFGDEAVLIHSSGHPVSTNYWGVTVQSLQHGAFYYLANWVKSVELTLVGDREYNEKLTSF